MNHFDSKTTHELVSHLFEADSVENLETHPGNPFGRYPSATVAINGGDALVQFLQKKPDAPYFAFPEKNGVVSLNSDDDYDDEYGDDPDSEHDRIEDTRDRNFHGILEDREGYIALFGNGPSYARGLYEFHITNGAKAKGMNTVHTRLGRNPGIDIPRFIVQPPANGNHSSGQITELIADMCLPTFGAENFYMVQHDLGDEEKGIHGFYWAHTHPAYYRRIASLAADTVHQYGDTIHDKSRRPKIVGDIAYSLDALYFNLSEAVKSAAFIEASLRTSRLGDVSDTDVANTWVRSIINRAQKRQLYIGQTILLFAKDVPESELMRRGYWGDIQLAAGIIDTRSTLHEVKPHPEADYQSTKRTLRILGLIKQELDRRLSYVQEYTLK